MLFLIGAFAALHLSMQRGYPAQDGAARRDTVRDSTATRGRHETHGQSDSTHHRTVTPADLATAYGSPAARQTLLRARAARMQQDSALVAYDAMSYSRVSVGMSLTKVGRDRLLYREENAARVRWRQGVGAHIDVTGARSVFPSVEGTKAARPDKVDASDIDVEVPYYPRYEPLWVGSDMVQTKVNDDELVNPLAEGAEAYYTYRVGDSISFRLPDGKSIQLRELTIHPRRLDWNVAVGSLWFDTGSGQLVRAAYRLALPLDVWMLATRHDPHAMDDVPVWIKPLLTPMKIEVTAIAIEYGLHEGRFWLPRSRLAEGSGQLSFVHVPVKMQESFTYASVNGADSLPPIVIDTTKQRTDKDTTKHSAPHDERKRPPCDTGTVERHLSMHGGSLPIEMNVSCDAQKLASSPDLPKSIYDAGDELFDAGDLNDLKRQALSLSVQPPIQWDWRALPRPTTSYGPSLMRYNRIEGLSFGASIDQQIGGGYSATATGRIGIADHEPNLELSVTRTNFADWVHLEGYNHLVSANDWGRPLSFSSSFAALLFGRDEGFYYRASGAELAGAHQAAISGGVRADWRLFVEQERTAAVHSNFALNGADLPPNLVAHRDVYSGIGLRLNHEYGLDPRGFRLSSDLRLEAAASDSIYGRAALDLTATRGLGRLAAALTVAGGSSVGAVPSQRRWYIGGAQTVRGQSPDTARSGNAFWMTRAEIGENRAAIRPSLFADLGWVGARGSWRSVGRPMSGVGVGVSFLDGLFRFDVARGIYPRKQFRTDLMLETKF